MLSAKCWPFFSGLNIGLFDAIFFHQGVSSTKAKKSSEIVHSSKLQNKILYQSKKELAHTFSTSLKRLQDRKWKSRLCSTIFIISYQTLAQCMCQSSTSIRNMYNLHNILYKITYNSILKPCVEQKKRHSIKYFRNISWDIYMSIISQNKIYPYFA